MKEINITRDSNGKVTFEPVSIDVTENVFFSNQDTQEAHWPYINKDKFPDFCDNQVGAASSKPSNSSQCNVPPPAVLTPPNNEVTYRCHIKGHEGELGTISVFAQLAPENVTWAPATKGTPIKEQQVVSGGQSPYAISDAQFRVTDNNNVIDSGSGIGPGLQLNPDQTNSGGITVKGTPTLSGTYNFTFTVDDGMGKNLQQVPYSMKVS